MPNYVSTLEIMYKVPSPTFGEIFYELFAHLLVIYTKLIVHALNFRKQAPKFP